MEEQKIKNQSHVEEEIAAEKEKVKAKQHLSYEQKKATFTMLLVHSTDGKLNSPKPVLRLR